MLLFILVLFFITNCKTIRVSPKKSTSSISSIEDFNSFYNRFHVDSVFQMSRIKFPLRGMYADRNGETKWDKKNWLLIKTKIYDVDQRRYKVYFKKTKNAFIQKVWIDNSGFRSECGFALIDKKWYLIYALEQNI